MKRCVNAFKRERKPVCIINSYKNPPRNNIVYFLSYLSSKFMNRGAVTPAFAECLKGSLLLVGWKINDYLVPCSVSRSILCANHPCGEAFMEENLRSLYRQRLCSLVLRSLEELSLKASLRDGNFYNRK